MTFKELKDWLEKLSEAQLKSEVTAYSSVIDEATPVTVGFNSVEEMGKPLRYIKKGFPLLKLDD